MLIFCAAVAGLQLLFALNFLARYRAGRRPGNGYSPAVSVIIPCKGAASSMEEGVRSILDQDYPGEREYIFVVPSAADPAYGELKGLLAAEPRARLAVSDAAPERCSEKALNLLHGIRLASPAAPVLVFADADLVFGRDWLSSLVAPLSDRRVAVSTAHALPSSGGVAGDLMRLWTEYGMVYLDSLGVVSGASAAVSREDFEALGVEAAWRRAVSEDIELGRLARRAGRKVRFVADAVPMQQERRSLPEVLSVTGKWTFYFKYYCPLIWMSGAALTAFKLYAAVWAFTSGHFLPLLLLLAGDATALNLVSSVFAGRGRVPAGPSPSAAALRRFSLILALPLLHAVNFAASALRREIVWGGLRYRLLSASEVRVLPPGTSPLSAWAAPAPVLIVSGILTGAAFFPEGNGWLFWFSMAPLFWAAMGTGPGGAFLSGWIFGTSAWVTGMHWMAGPIGVFLRVPPAAGMGAFILICAYHGLTFAFLAWASRAGSEFFSRRFGWSRGTALLAAAMPAAAAAESLFPSVFPVYFANSQLFHLPFVQILEFTGPQGLVWLLTGLNASVYLFAAALARRRDTVRLKRAGAALAVFALLLVLNYFFGRRRMAAVDAAAAEGLAAGLSVKAAILQGSAPVDNKPGQLNGPGLEIYRRMTAEAVKMHAPDLVVWPESVYGRRVHFRDGSPPSFTPEFGAVFAGDIQPGADLLLNSDGQEPGPGGGPVYNIALSVDRSGNLAGVVRKRRLFPFGEYIPLGARFPWLYRLIPGADRLSPGGEPDPLPAAGAKAGVLICYEDLYTAAPRAFAGKGADLLVNMTNEIRFGYDGAPQHHLWYGAIRAVEYRKFLLRAVNTGMSSVIDPCGRVLALLGVKERAVIVHEVPLMPSSTFYSRHGRLLGHSGLLALAALLLAALFRPRRDKT